ncbi:PPOX class F420-dependent oxidoreductase [Gordonia neofelifaecis]|uniref:Putative F420-dependent enzyme n=1 Tax=Gordonia neofelifaecis NRRL B-59395 TaxID=644548 RepID=F1YE16_9ACTN|nr:PPOX class F420-dependent oxidoreductase [Gordonia neofelifaecis]EGD57106.1 putative F420-dependent enzyme [Gordonia neofelifaecis NRRL B-59395]
MARTVATNTAVELSELLDFIRTRHHVVLSTTRGDGSSQMSPVTAGVDEQGRIVIATYPGRAKTANARRHPTVGVLVLSENFNDAWVQVDGTAEVLDMPDAEDALVDYFRSIAGEHSDWDEYRAAMRVQNKSLIRITPTRWGPIATGGFPQDVADRLDAAEG